MSSGSAVEVTCITTGAVRPKRGERGIRRYLPGGWSGDPLPVHAYLVRHPEGACLFDTGQSARAARRGYFPAWYPFFRLARFELGPQDEARVQLRDLGIGAGELRWVVLSHLHTDHAGGLAGLGAGEVVVSRAEWARAVGRRGRLRGYLPQYWPAEVTPRLVDFDGPRVGPFPGSCPLTSDGALVLVPTPGHTPGHMSLLVGGAYLLAGDLCESAERLEDENPALARYCRDEELAVLTAHDPHAATRLTERRARARREPAR